MATPSRPLLALRQTPERHTRQKTRSPQHHGGHLLTKDRDASAPVTTRRTILATPQQPPPRSLPPSSSSVPPPDPRQRPRPSSSSSFSSRKRPASALIADDASADASASARPPTKVTVTQPHGELLRITNGVPATLGLHQDDIPSGPSTPGATLDTPVAASQSQSQDKRSLRSHDGGSRLKSDLATYFANYDDIIAGLPETSGTYIFYRCNPLFPIPCD
jgi:hypothetical protein